MKRLLYISLITLIISCNNTGKTNEKFQYERVKEDNTSIPANNMVSNNVILNSNDQMKFDKKIRVNANESVTLTLNHTGRFPAISMGHNFVLIKKDVDVDEYAIRAISARDYDYIPEGGDEIAFTKMLGGGESDTITFDAPEPGTYTFICSFPGHYQIMMGEFIVI